MNVRQSRMNIASCGRSLRHLHMHCARGIPPVNRRSDNRQRPALSIRMDSYFKGPGSRQQTSDVTVGAARRPKRSPRTVVFDPHSLAQQLCADRCQLLLLLQHALRDVAIAQNSPHGRESAEVLLQLCNHMVWSPYLINVRQMLTS